MPTRTRADYINAIEIGNIVAFVNPLTDTMHSGRVIGVGATPEIEFCYTIKTKNGSIYYATPEEIRWVKNGTHWPDGIFNALKMHK